MVWKVPRMILQIGNKNRLQIKDVKSKKIYGLRSAVCGPKGLTLIEVLLAVLILSIGVVAVLQAYAGSLAALQAAQTTMTSVSLLNQKAGEVQQAIFEKIKIEQAGEEGEFESPFEDFAWTWEIKPADRAGLPAGEAGLYELTVMISNQLDTHAVSVKTYVIGKKEEEDAE